MIVAQLSWSDYITDSTGLMVMLATIMNVLPPAAALLSLVLMSIRIYETQTVQDLLWKLRMNAIKRRQERNDADDPR